MSAYRDTLPGDEARARYGAAIASAATAFAAACRDRDGLAAAEGPGAVAEAAWYPGHPLGSPGAIEARYEQMQEAARQEQAA